MLHDMAGRVAARPPIDRLLDSNLRLGKLGNETDLRQAIVAETAALLGAQRVLLWNWRR